MGSTDYISAYTQPLLTQCTTGASTLCLTCNDTGFVPGELS